MSAVIDLVPRSDASIMPVNIEAEQQLLGMLMYDNAAYERLSDSLRASHFYEPFHQRLFEVVSGLISSGQMAEPILLAERFSRDPAFKELGGVVYLADMVDRAAPAAWAHQYASTILDLAIRRDLIRLSGEIGQGAMDPANELTAREQIEAAEGALYGLGEHGQTSTGLIPFADVLAGAVDLAAKAYQRDGGLSGLSTGLNDLDQKIGGLHPSDLVIIAARPSMGKAQPLDAKVLLADGSWTTMGAVKVGDALASVDGAPSKVEGVFPQGERDILRVTLADGRSTECCPEHLWLVSCRHWPSPRVLQASALATLIGKQRYRNRVWIEPLSGDFGDDTPLPVDPWVLGALLGDGYIKSGSPMFSTNDPNTVHEMAHRLGAEFSINYDSKHDFRIVTAAGKTRPGTSGVVPNALTTALKALRLHGCGSHNKFIPPAYLRANRAARVDLLRGLLDTDGWIETFGAVRFCTISETLAGDVVELVRSLGGKAGIGQRSPRYTYRGVIQDGQRAFVVNISNLSADDIFTVPSKLVRVRPGARTSRLNVASITPSRRAEAQCIKVSHPSSLYVTDDYIVTHNTSLACNIAYEIARRYAFEQQPDGTKKTVAGGRVAFFSLEMSAEQLGLRVLAEAAGVSGDRIRKGEIDASEFGRIRDAAVEIQGSPLYTDATGAISLGKLAARARRMKRQHGLDVIFVDYLQLVTGNKRYGGGERVQEISEVTQGLKALAKELDVPIVALAQLSRQVEQRADKKPQLSDLRESGSIEQDADMVMFIYREEYYLTREEPRADTPEHLSWQEKMDQCRGLAEVIIGKQRHGPIGIVRLAFDEDLTKFNNLAGEAYRPGPASHRLPPSERDD